MTFTAEQLEAAAGCVNGEWILLADSAALLPQGQRSPAGTAALEATLLHARCLINFCSGDWHGRRTHRDIQPANFLGIDWWPGDEQFDRGLRGRLQFINQEVAHLSWQRVLNTDPLIASVRLVAHEVNCRRE